MRFDHASQALLPREKEEICPVPILSMGGRAFRLAPSMAVICDIEDELGPLPELLKKFSGTDWCVWELVSCVHILLDAAGHEEDYECLGMAMMEEGLEPFRSAVVNCFKKVMTPSSHQ